MPDHFCMLIESILTVFYFFLIDLKALLISLLRVPNLAPSRLIDDERPSLILSPLIVALPIARIFPVQIPIDASNVRYSTKCDLNLTLILIM